MEDLNQQPLIGAYLMLIIDGKVLLQRRKCGYYDGKYSLVCGHTEKGETVIEAVVREAKEEANILLDPKKLVVKVVVHRTNSLYKGRVEDIIDMFVFADGYEGEIKNNEPDRCSELDFYSLDDLPKETINYVIEALEAFKRGVFYIVNRD